MIPAVNGVHFQWYAAFLCVCVLIILVCLPFSHYSDYLRNNSYELVMALSQVLCEVVITILLLMYVYLKANVLYCLYIRAPAIYRPNLEINCAKTSWKAQCCDSVSKNYSITSLFDVGKYSLSHHQARCVTGNFGIRWVHSCYIVHDINAWRKDVLRPFYVQTTTEQILMNSGNQAMGELKRLYWKLSGKFNHSSCKLNITP